MLDRLADCSQALCLGLILLIATAAAPLLSDLVEQPVPEPAGEASHLVISFKRGSLLVDHRPTKLPLRELRSTPRPALLSEPQMPLETLMAKGPVTSPLDR